MAYYVSDTAHLYLMHDIAETTDYELLRRGTHTLSCFILDCSLSLLCITLVKSIFVICTVNIMFCTFTLCCTSKFHTNFEIVYPAMQFESVGAAES